MPFIVDAKRPCRLSATGDKTFHENCPECSASRRAVATLDEAQTEAWGMVSGRPWDNDVSAYDAAAELARNLPESGGTVGPLPDGTIIEVVQVSVRELVAQLPGRKYQPGFDQEFIDAFNARKAA